MRNVTIIYNPNSTGDGKQNALRFAERLKRANIKAIIRPTSHAGHAYTLAKQTADNSTSAIIISSSGDGGYNEVINGVLDSRNTSVITGVLPSGNANDHYRAVHRGNAVRRIAVGDTDQIDVLKLSYGHRHHYAHSYIGLGLTPHVGEALTEASLNPFKEFWLVATHIFRRRPVKIRYRGRTRRYDHLVFANIGHIAKHLQLSVDSRIDDGQFEIIGVKCGSLGALIRHLLAAVTRRGRHHARKSSFEFTTLLPAKIQLDGEVIQLPESTKVRIEVVPRALTTIV